MSLIHYLFYVCCKFNIVIAAVHIPGLKNSPAVALSQLQVGQYLMFCDTHNLTALPGDENTILLFINDLAKILVVAHQINRINLVVFLANCVPKNCTQYYMAINVLS